MNKCFIVWLLICFACVQMQAQDRMADSIAGSITAAKTDEGKINAQIALVKYLYGTTRPDTMFAVLNDAFNTAKQKGLQEQEMEALGWLGKAYGTQRNSRRFPGKGYQYTLQVIELAKKYRSVSTEARMLTQLAELTADKRDSSLLLLNQSLQLSLQHNLPAQRVNALIAKGVLFSDNNPDSARQLLTEAITVAKQAELPAEEIDATLELARLYSLNHEGDSANHLMQSALRLSEKHGLVDQQIDLLRESIATEAGFFLKDSFVTYYERLRALTRQYGRDSLLIMNNFAQSATDVGDFAQALKTYYTLLHVHEERKDSADIENVLYGIALCYEATRDYKKSLEYLYQAEKYGQHNPFIYIFINVDMAKCYTALQQKDSARHYAARAYDLAIVFYRTPSEIYGGVLNDLGTVYNELGIDSLSIDYLRRSYVYFTTKSIQYLNYCASTIGLASYFKRKEQIDSSMYYGRLCLNTARDKGFLPFISEASGLIAANFQHLRKADSALYYQQIGFDAYKTMYSDESSRQFQNMAFSEQQRQQGIEFAKKMAADQYASKLRLYALATVIAVALIIGLLVFRNNRQRQRSYELLKQQKQEIDIQKSKLENSLTELQATQSQLVQSEKMASLGELTAGIAHEIQNPLNFVNNFSEINTELLDELEHEAANGNWEEVKAIAKDIRDNEEKINHHGKRADGIVKSMLQHSRSSGGQKEPTDINALASEYLRLAYHGLRAKDKSFNATLQTDFDATIGTVKLVPQDMGRVLLNIITNAFYAVAARAATKEQGYEPTVSIRTKKMAGKLLLSVEDNGGGIPPAIADKIFQPFFTTKPTGQGTGLGLSLAYDIVKAHGGELTATNNKNGGASFVIQLPAV